jgi:Xaa-Pro aminopeptidase
MVSAFARADEVHAKVKSWLCAAVSKGGKITEAEVCQKTEKLFGKSGAVGLSFQVLAAAGKHGAIIHYSHPDGVEPIREGELFLLDTGAFYEGGLATDLTRTFLVGAPHVKATDEQRRLFTLVLKGAIAGMRARLPVGATGEQLDALVRQPMWQAGLDYGHGTGHGVGVNVHESPPRVTIGSRVTLEPGQVFSIEPGLYLPDFGGIRIENLCTIVEDSEVPRDGVPRRFLRVVPLTFSPLDKRLIDRSLLTAGERAFLTWFHDRKRGPLPPLA